MIEIVIDALRPILKNKEIRIEASTVLIGGDGIIDSLGLVELCLRLEDAAIREGFEFDWTSENAMSQSRGIFRNIRSLTDEFSRQKLQQS